MNTLTSRVREATRSFTEVFANRDLRRLQLAWAGSLIGNWSYFVALAIYAYDEGGAGAVGAVSMIRLVPAAIASPFMGGLADRFSRKLVMVLTDVARAAFMLAAAVVIWQGWSAYAVYALVALSTIVGTAFRPAQAALLPNLARTPSELTAANVSSSTLEAVGAFAGPALGGAVLAVTSVETVFALNAISFVWSALLVLAVRGGGRPREKVAPADAKPHDRHGFAAGFRAIFSGRDLVVLAGLYTAQTLVAGALNVLVVVTALSVLDLSDSGVGYLNGALGAGGLVGGFVALVLATRGRLAFDFGLGLALFGAPLVVMGLSTSVAVAAFALATVGLANSIVDVSGLTIMQRAVPDEVLARALGVLQGTLIGAMGVGALLAPILIHLVGIRSALVLTGLLLPVLTLLAAPRLRSIDGRTAAPEHVALLRKVDLLEPLPLATLESLAGSLEARTFPAGATIVSAGEAGDVYYVIESGEVEVAGRRLVAGDSFGEIALLRDVPRTANVVAATDVGVVVLEREQFVAAVTGHEPAKATADEVIAAKLGSFDPAIAKL